VEEQAETLVDPLAEPVQELLAELTTFGLLAAVLVGLGVAVFLIHRWLLAFYADKPSQQHYRQLIMVCVYLFAAILAIILMPLSDLTQGQLLGFLGILLSATIALSSTTLVGNVLAGVMVKSLRNMRPGDYIRVGDNFGRISIMDLLHVEIQTEDRGLTTLPNLYLVTNPVQVIRSSGTILNVAVSLGYEVPRGQVEDALLKAAGKSGLEKPFVQILQLGDFSVSYQISALLTDVEQLIGMRRKLRAQVLDELHAAGIQIVSPTYMNTRALTVGALSVPEAHADTGNDKRQPDPDAMVFDKAKQAEDLDRLKKDYTAMSQELIGIEQELKQAGPGDERQPINLRKKKLEARMLRAEKEIHQLESELSGHHV
jgi:small-conductance mechanosensitive channel